MCLCRRARDGSFVISLTRVGRLVGWLVGWRCDSYYGLCTLGGWWAAFVGEDLAASLGACLPYVACLACWRRCIEHGTSDEGHTHTHTHTHDDDPPTIVLTRSRRSTAIPTATTREFRSTLRPRTTKWYAARPALRLASRLLSLVIHTGQEDHLQVPAQLQKVCRHSVAGPCAAPVWRLVRRAHASSRAHAHTAHTPPRPRPRRRLC